MSDFKNLKGAVLMIGSLLWENESNCIRYFQNPNKDRESLSKARNREVWRDSYVEMEQKKQLHLPIRYGRLSSSRKDTFTMVFSSSMQPQDFGTAWIAPLKSIALKEHLEQLALAEGIISWSNRNNLASQFNALKLGCIGIKILKNSKLVEKAWSAAFCPNKYFKEAFDENNRAYQVDDEERVINKQGHLLINFEIPSGFNEVDYILCAVMNPERAQYPNSWEISQAIMKNDYVDYFNNNVDSGIITCQDKEIRNALGKDL